MPLSATSMSHVAHVEDADEDSGSSVNGIEGTRKYANKSPKSTSKERPNTGKSRKENKSAMSKPPSSGAGLHESAAEKKSRPPSRRPSEKDRGDPELRALDREKRRSERRQRDEEEGRKATAAAAAAAAAAENTEPKAPPPKDGERREKRRVRPPLAHVATQPIIQQSKSKKVTTDDPASFGVIQPATSGRPRGMSRHATYSGQPRRIPTASGTWYPAHSHPHPQHAVGTYPPPPAWHGVGVPAGSMLLPVGPPAMPPPMVNHMYDPSNSSIHTRLQERFQRGDRPPSTMGQEHYGPGARGEGSQPMPRRHSRSRQADEERRQMPPPDYIPSRPQSARPPSAVYRAPVGQRPSSRQGGSRPPASHRRSIGFVDSRMLDEMNLGGENPLYSDAVTHYAPPPERRAGVRSRRDSAVYERYESEVDPVMRARRASMHGTALPSGGVSLDDRRYDDAVRYQEAVNGAPPSPLTAEALRRASRRGGAASSRSTRSSGSRDDSEYKRSNTTGFTRTSITSDDFTIKVPGGARVRMPGPGVEIDCEDGGEITFSTRPNAPRSSSDGSSGMYPQIEDTRSRMERLALQRPRAPSQTDSYSRAGYTNQPSYDPYTAGGFF